MAIDLYWDDDDLKTLLCVFDGRWTWDELHAVLRTVRNITDDLEHEVAAIVDLRKGTGFPGGSPFTPDGLENARQLLKMGGAKTGKIVVVGGGGLVRLVVNAVAQLDKTAVNRVRLADDMTQARHLLSPPTS